MLQPNEAKEILRVIEETIAEDVVSYVEENSIFYINGDKDKFDYKSIANVSAKESLEELVLSIGPDVTKSLEKTYLRDFKEQKMILLNTDFDIGLFEELRSKGMKRMFIPMSVWTDILMSQELIAIHTRENGLPLSNLGKLGDVEVFTDMHREREFTVLENKEFYWFK